MIHFFPSFFLALPWSCSGFFRELLGSLFSGSSKYSRYVSVSLLFFSPVRSVFFCLLLLLLPDCTLTPFRLRTLEDFCEAFELEAQLLLSCYFGFRPKSALSKPRVPRFSFPLAAGSSLEW